MKRFVSQSDPHPLSSELHQFGFKPQHLGLLDQASALKPQRFGFLEQAFGFLEEHFRIHIETLGVLTG
jgi:hypothetical protein